MTDAKTYFVSVAGSVVRASDVMSYRPQLVMKVQPKGTTSTGSMQYVGDFMVAVETDAFRRGHDDIMLRFDRDAPTKETWDTSADRRALFAPDWKALLAKLSAATNLTVRYATTLGFVRTSRFEVSGLTNALRQVKLDYVKTQGGKH